MGLDVEYSGWNAWVVTEHVLALGSKTTEPNPLAVLAVILPAVPAVRSLITTWNPADVSCKRTDSWSPEFMKKSLLAFRSNLPGFSGLAEEVATPFLVM